MPQRIDRHATCGSAWLDPCPGMAPRNEFGSSGPHPCSGIARLSHSRVSRALRARDHAHRRIMTKWIPPVVVAQLICLPFVPLREASAQEWEAPVERVEIQRVKPETPEKPTLRFLHENLQFLRARLDPLREVRELETKRVGQLDPSLLRFLALGRSLAADEQRRAELAANGADRDALMESVRAIANLEAELDRIGALLDSATVRVGMLEDDFLVRQETVLLCLVRGGGGAVPDQITMRSEDGRKATVVIDESEARMLQNGGMLQIWHDFVEPRKQSLQFGFGSSARGTDVRYVQIDPVRDRLNVLEIDFSQPDMARANVWSHPDPSTRGDLW